MDDPLLDPSLLRRRRLSLPHKFHLSESSGVLELAALPGAAPQHHGPPIVPITSTSASSSASSASSSSSSSSAAAVPAVDDDHEEQEGPPFRQAPVIPPPPPPVPPGLRTTMIGKEEEEEEEEETKLGDNDDATGPPPSSGNKSSDRIPPPLHQSAWTMTNALLSSAVSNDEHDNDNDNNGMMEWRRRLKECLHQRETEQAILLQVFDSRWGSGSVATVSASTASAVAVSVVVGDNTNNNNNHHHHNAAATASAHLRRPSSSSLTATAGSSSPSEVVLLSGPLGSGKTRLAQVLQQPAVQSGGYFLSGKFDRLHLDRPAPYTAFCEAFADWAREVRHRGPTVVNNIRESLHKALGPSEAAVLVRMIPEVGVLCGLDSGIDHDDTDHHTDGLPNGEGHHHNNDTTTPSHNSSNTGNKAKAEDAIQRFVFVFRTFLRAISSPEHPLVLLLDDLHWAVRAATLPSYGIKRVLY